MSVELNDLPFIDLYVRLDQPDKAYYRSKIRAESAISQFVPDEYQLSIDRFMRDVNEKLQEHNDGAILSEGVRCRLSRQKMSDGSHWVCARRINTVIPDIEKLGMPPALLPHMLGLGRRDGLIVVSGATGAGKTTSAVGLLGYYLKNYGGTAVTIEDPCEFMLAGRHGTGGQCFQVEVEKEEDWAMCLKRALRWAPRYIYVGEIRTPKAAEQLLRAASTGHLVITTVHAGAIEEALMGIIFLAEQAMGSGVRSMLAGSLTSIIYQTMKETGPYIRYLYTEENSPGDPIRALIREDKIGMLSTYIDRIAARLQNTPQAMPAGRKA
ncbi:MAG: Flp pilus assembly complex ATPase component TadA [Alphaproteobacteria bacterium]|nr:Flp pilus assembly complex ATPase component TadA [Alphaproteobacteria bacterium]